MAISKTKSSFYRRLYVAHLIDSGIASVPDILEYTGMPRRTAQDTIKSLADLDIVCIFKQTQGERNRSGKYEIKDWGAINKTWIADNIAEIKQVLNYP
ncbi:winged helix-turn-helix domain-containing protein [Photobacterium sp. DA100]|uniref:winged helix-turn-helix domain-containing protein n=1 Tax=Photobacterium sp. DA100 TaxID=3027472 RepID=UPI00247B0E3E|nr:winged helix-turn-helix domain-containing protein [Photobacterium sp. DA100]WEM40970.1 winged helix-turn-helix domain-containing protein [Photobacterium sp. DA100]